MFTYNLPKKWISGPVVATLVIDDKLVTSFKDSSVGNGPAKEFADQEQPFQELSALKGIYDKFLTTVGGVDKTARYNDKGVEVEKGATMNYRKVGYVRIYRTINGNGELHVAPLVSDGQHPTNGYALDNLPKWATEASAIRSGVSVSAADL